MNENINIPAGSHPGLYLDTELKKRGWLQADLIFILGCAPNTVNQIIMGKRGISPDMSKALGEVFNLPDNHFAILQNAHEIANATAPNPSVSLRAKLRSNYPIREMIKRGWLKDADGEELAAQLARFFEVNDATEIPYIAHAARKSSYEELNVPPVQLAWLFKVRQIAKTMPVPKYSKKALEEALIRMRDMLVAPEEARHVPRILAGCGVRFVIVETLPSAKIDGVCFWLDNNSPVIGLSMRFDRIDNFWFVLRHEIEHVLCGHGKVNGVIDAELEGAKTGTDSGLPAEEIQANGAAAKFCVPQDKMQSFLARKYPFFHEKDVLAFAKLNGVHPGLVVGQVQYKLGRYDYLRNHQVKIRQHVLPSAMVDGWKQTATKAGE